MRRALRGSAWWSGIGIALLAGVAAGSVFDLGQPAAVAGIDKLNHVAAYGVLMYWWGMVHPRARLAWLLALAAMGIALELVQSLLPYRFPEWADLAANLVGIALGRAALATPAGGLLTWLDRQIGDRLDARRP